MSEIGRLNCSVRHSMCKNHSFFSERDKTELPDSTITHMLIICPVCLRTILVTHTLEKRPQMNRLICMGLVISISELTFKL